MGIVRARVYTRLNRLIPAGCLPEIALIAFLQILWGGAECVDIVDTIYQKLQPDAINAADAVSHRASPASSWMKVSIDLLLSSYQVVLGVALLRMARWAQWGASAFFLLVIVYKLVVLLLPLGTRLYVTLFLTGTGTAMHEIGHGILIALFDIAKYVMLLSFLWTARAVQAFYAKTVSPGTVDQKCSSVN
jgi:hypothetical protein